MLKFERVGSVERTDRGLLAALEGERLRVEPVRADVVRVKISRGGVFDERPTFAVCAEPDPVEFSVEREDGVVRLRTSALVVSLSLDPFALDVHRPDGTSIVESLQPYATLNDAFEVKRRCASGD